MRKILLGSIAAALLIVSLADGAQAQAPAPVTKMTPIKTRLDHFSGTNWILVISYLSSEITSITCDRWTMLGINSYKHQNDFSIPGGPSVAVMDSSHFDGYCKGADSIKAHTDDGDFSGVLDRGAGNWDASTKLTFGLQTGQ